MILIRTKKNVVTYKRKIEALRVAIFAMKSTITCSACVPVALVIQHAMRMRRIMSPVTCLAVPRL